MHYALLSGRGLAAVSGADAMTFLQGLVSNDVAGVREGRAVYAALLTPQGKFLHDFFLNPWPGGILIDCDKARLPDLLQRLNMYKLRSQVAVEAMPEHMGVLAAWGEMDIAPVPGFPVGKGGGLIVRDPRLHALGWRMMGNLDILEPWCRQQGMEKVTEQEYESLRLKFGVPEGASDMIPDKSLLLEFGFEDLHGVDFKKGCYVGQEVTARSKFRGQVRRFIYQVRAQSGALPQAGTPVMLGDAQAGEMRSSSGGTGLALLRVEAVEMAQKVHTELRCGNAALIASLPPWVAHAPKALTIQE